MKTIKALGLVAAMSLALEPIAMLAPALAVSAPSGIDSRLHLDWDAGTGRGVFPRTLFHTEAGSAVGESRTRNCVGRIQAARIRSGREASSLRRSPTLDSKPS